MILKSDISLHVDLFVSIFLKFTSLIRVFPGVSEVKNLPAIQGTLVRSLGWKVSLEKEMATQYSCLVNPMGSGACQAMVRRVAKSWTWLKQFSTHGKTNYINQGVTTNIHCFLFWFFFLLSLCWIGPVILHWVIRIELLERKVLSTWMWQVGTGRRCRLGRWVTDFTIVKLFKKKGTWGCRDESRSSSKRPWILSSKIHVWSFRLRTLFS